MIILICGAFRLVRPTSDADTHYQARLGQPFSHEDYLANLTQLRDQLKDALSRTPSVDEDSEPSAADLAERIQNLKAAQSIESAPRHTHLQSTSTAEEPIITRVRRRAKPATASAKPETDQTARGAADPPPPASTTPITTIAPRPVRRERKFTDEVRRGESVAEHQLSLF